MNHFTTEDTEDTEVIIISELELWNLCVFCGEKNQNGVVMSTSIKNSASALQTIFGSSSNLVVISFLFQLSSSFLILLKVVDMFAF